MRAKTITFEQASQSLLDAAIDPLRWNAAMDLLGEYAGAKGAVMFAVKGQCPGTPHSQSLSDGLSEYFRDGWNERDERVRGIPLLRQRNIFTDQDFATPEEMASSDYYRGLLAHHECNWSAVVGFTDPEDEWSVVFERGDRQGFFDSSEQDDLVRFSAPLRQAATLSRSLAYAGAIGALDAYQAIGCASFLMDTAGLVVRHNEKAQALIGNGLELFRRELRSMHAPDNAQLQALIASHRPGKLVTQPTVHTVLIRRRERRPLLVRGLRLQGLAASIFTRGAILLLVSDPEDRGKTATPETLTRMFGLTETEAVLTLYLEAELTLAEAAARMSITVETVRTHMKRILTKTGTHRQQDLLMLLRRLRP